MEQRIAAGVLLEDEDRVLLVRHNKPGAYDFWVAPGGGVEGTEDVLTCARREVLEECGLQVEPLDIAYVEEFHSPLRRECKVWFTARLIGGNIGTARAEASREHIVEAAFLSRGGLNGKTIFPSMLRDEYWEDRKHGFSRPRYVGLRAMEFYSCLAAAGLTYRSSADALRARLNSDVRAQQTLHELVRPESLPRVYRISMAGTACQMRR